jgi:hypothetical protein
VWVVAAVRWGYPYPNRVSATAAKLRSGPSISRFDSTVGRLTP